MIDVGQSQTPTQALRTMLTTRLVAELPRVLALLDKNPLSSSFGSFDRKYWHYKILDFPCGMQQELVLPVAFAFARAFPGNTYCGKPRLAEFVRAAFDYHRASMHRDGSLDDYFPYERALGASAYALAALTEAALLTGLADNDHLAAFEQTGRFVASWPERGLLSNHYAIAAAALANLGKLTNDKIWAEKARRLVERLAAVQHVEGWFPEYGGCDLGYQTVTLEFLARYARTTGDQAADRPLRTALPFLRRFLHPDGSFGGEYGSRNTYNFYPGGFALLSPRFPEAAEMLSGYLSALDTPAENRLADDGVFGHMLSSYVTTLDTDIRVAQPIWPPTAEPQLHYFPGCKFFLGQTGELRVYGGVDKGGVLKVFEANRLVLSDTGFAGTLADGTSFLQNAPGIGSGEVTGTAVAVRGELQRYRSRRLTLAKMVVLRVLALAYGWWPGYSHFIRAAMQRLLIFGRDGISLRFTRTIRLEPQRVTVEDILDNPAGRAIARLFRSSDCVNIHVITSDSFQASNLSPWLRLDPPGAGATARFTQILEATKETDKTPQ